MATNYFTQSELTTLRKGRDLVRSYICGRTLTLASNRGVRLSVSGRGIPCTITVRCNRVDVNLVAACLLSGSFQ